MTDRKPGNTLDEIEAAFAPLASRKLLDIGCGPGRLVDALGRRGAVVAGVDPEAATVAKARERVPAAEIHQCGGEALPFAEGSFDGAIFLNSLHHVPGPLMKTAIREALRVVGPEGSVLVVEPLAEGSSFAVLQPLEDETEIRAQAQTALSEMIAAGDIALIDVTEHDRVEVFAALDQFIAHALDVDPGRAARLDLARPEMAARFAALSQPGPSGGHLLAQPLRLHRFRAPR